MRVVLLVMVVCWEVGAAQGSASLLRTLHALTRGVHFMETQVENINLDAVYCVRQVQELLETYLTHQKEEFLVIQHWVQTLRDRAKRVADHGSRQVRKTDPEYAKVVGYLMESSVSTPWYPSRPTDHTFLESRVKCDGTTFNETASDLCFNQLGDKTCAISPSCKEMNTIRHQRDYTLTHQMLFWRLMETHCEDRIPEAQQQRFCANVLRDAKVITNAGYPSSHVDLFMEQIGLCGFWGFSDFNQDEWLEKILDWQEQSGCYTGSARYYCNDNLQPDPPKRTKRREEVLPDDCLAHRTGVALLAMAVNLRFEAEKNFKNMDKSQNKLNQLLL